MKLKSKPMSFEKQFILNMILICAIMFTVAFHLIGFQMPIPSYFGLENYIMFLTFAIYLAILVPQWIILTVCYKILCRVIQKEMRDIWDLNCLYQQVEFYVKGYNNPIVDIAEIDFKTKAQFLIRNIGMDETRQQLKKARGHCEIEFSIV